MYLTQGTLGMGDRDYYIEDTDRAHPMCVRAYAGYLRRLAEAGRVLLRRRNRLADNTIAIRETQLAHAAAEPREELRDPAASYNPYGYVGACG